MSAGAFINSRYQDDRGNVYACRIQPETLQLNIDGTVNAATANQVDQPIRARMTGSRKKYGTRARSIRVKFTGTPPTGYEENGIVEIPILTQAAYNAMTAEPNIGGTYLGVDVEVLGGTPESRR